MIKTCFLLGTILLTISKVALAGNEVVLLPLGDNNEGDVFPLIIPAPATEQPDEIPSGELAEALPKPMIFNKGWDQTLNNITLIDPTVSISLKSITPVFGYPGILFDATEIRHWGVQTFWSGGTDLYAKGVLLVDKGDALEGGPFEWARNQQGHMSFHNIVRADHPASWIRDWTDPRPGEQVWFFLLSDDEKYSSNPITFIWP